MGFPRMIVRCTYDKGVALTAREEYDVEYCTPTYCFVRNDDGDVQGFSFDRFSVIQHGVTRASDPEWEDGRDKALTEELYRYAAECETMLAKLDDETLEQPSQKAIDSHYSTFVYTLTSADKKEGTLKVDPYFVAKQWGLGKKDDTGVLFHCLKNISRYSDKNTKEREIKALYLQVKRLAELENVNLE